MTSTSIKKLGSGGGGYDGQDDTDTQWSSRTDNDDMPLLSYKEDYLPGSPSWHAVHRPQPFSRRVWSALRVDAAEAPTLRGFWSALIHPTIPTLWGYALFLALFAILSIVFKMPSTLWIYLSIWILIPFFLIANAYLLAGRQFAPGKAEQKRWFIVHLLAVTCWILPSLFVQPYVPALPMFGPLAHPAVAPPPGSTVYIANNLYNVAPILPQFSRSLERLIDLLGPKNVFVSIYESGSSDETPEMLRALDERLKASGVRTAISTIIEPRVNINRSGAAGARNGRIPFLAHVRNMALTPLDVGGEVEHGLDGRPFDRLLFLNDIYFDAAQAVELLATNGGRYDQACAIDYIPFGMYDTFVAADINNRRGKPVYPFFDRPEDILAVRHGRVMQAQSCWGGMTAFDARWFTQPVRRDQVWRGTAGETDDAGLIGGDSGRVQTTESVGFEAELGVVGSQPLPLYDEQGLAMINVSLPEPTPSLPLRFRWSPRCFASECRLITLDMNRAAAPGYVPRVLINTRIVVAYDAVTFYMWSRVVRWAAVMPWRWVWWDGINLVLRHIVDPHPANTWCPDANAQDGWRTVQPAPALAFA